MASKSGENEVPLGCVHINDIVMTWLQEIERSSVSELQQPVNINTLNLSNVKLKNIKDKTRFNLNRDENRRKQDLPSQSFNSRNSGGTITVQVDFGPVRERQFTISQTLITVGNSKCNVMLPIDNESNLGIDNISEVHFQKIESKPFISKKRIKVHKQMVPGNSEIPLSVEENLFSGNWTTEQKISGKIYITLEGKDKKKHFEGEMEEIVRFAAEMDRFKSCCTRDGTILSRGTYSGSTIKKIVDGE